MGASLESGDWSGLQGWLDGQSDSFGRIRSIEKFGGGQSNPTFRLSTTVRECVLRRKPSGVLLPSAHAVDREYRVIQALGASGVPVPEVYGFCEDPRVVGSAFYVMDYIPGQVYWDPQLPGMPAERRAAIYREMNRVLACLHEIDPAEIGLADFGRPAGYFSRQIRRWTDQYRATETDRREDIEALIAWLPANLPADDGQVALVHGDFRLDNLIFGTNDRVVSVLDWELSTLGHPYADLAYQCAQWRLPAGALRGLAGVSRAGLGIPTEREYVRDYRVRRDLPPIDGWAFYLTLSLFRLASICQGVFRRGLDGNASSVDARGFGDKVALIAAAAMAIVTEANSFGPV